MEQYITVKQAAERKGVTQSAIYKAIAGNRLPATEMLGRFALKPADVDACDFGSYRGIQRTNKIRGTEAQKQKEEPPVSPSESES